MRLFFAGEYAVADETKFVKQIGVRNRLVSFHYKGNRTIAKEWGSKGLMLDSGAFSAWSLGASIDMRELIAFIQHLEPEFAIQLDVIGDEDGTWNNYMAMSKQVDCLPVIHYRASKKHIERVLKAPGMACLGGLVPLSRKKNTLKKWLDYIFSFPEARGKRLHCLGIMSPWVLQRYPFYSADSSTATSALRYPQNDIMMKLHQRRKDRAMCVKPLIQKQLELEKKVTRLWERRGVIWSD